MNALKRRADSTKKGSYLFHSEARQYKRKPNHSVLKALEFTSRTTAMDNVLGEFGST